MDSGRVGRLLKYVKYIMTSSASGINSSLYPVNVRKQQAGSVYCKNYF
jgi:hypothetical protein